LLLDFDVTILIDEIVLGQWHQVEEGIFVQKKLVPANSSKDFIVIIGIAARCSHFLICLVPISSTFYDQLLRTKIPNMQKKVIQAVRVFLHFWDLCA